MKLNVTMDERFVNTDSVWESATDTLFDLYDHVGETTVPLNYLEAEVETMSETERRRFKKVLMIPLSHETQSILMIPHPEKWSADLYAVEFPERPAH